MHSIRLPEYRIGIKFDKDPFAVEQNSYLSKVVNFYIAHDLDTWPRNPTYNFKFQNCLFRAFNVANNTDKKYVYSEYGIAFDSAGSWSFGNNTAKSFLIFGADNSFLILITAKEINIRWMSNFQN